MGTESITNPKKGRNSVSVLAGVFLIAALMIGAVATFVMTTAAITVTKTAEATSLLDLCKTYGISCPDPEPESEPESEPDPEPEPEPDPEPSPSGDLCKTYGISCPDPEPESEPESEPDPEPTTGEPSYTKMIWTTTRSVTAQRDLANAVLSGEDTVVFHYGSGQDPTQAQINALKGVTRVSDSKKGMEFFSLAEIREHAPTVKANGFGFISYNLEAGASPDREVANPLESVRQAKTIADENGIGLWVAPSNAISSGQYADDIAIRAGSYHLQSQPKQDDDTTCQIMKDWVDSRVRLFEDVKSGLEGKITFQVTLTSKPAPGKTIYETAKDCIDKAIPGDVDGVSIWWGGAQFDDGTYKQLLKYVEDKYS